LINPSPGCRFRPSTANSVRCARTSVILAAAARPSRCALAPVRSAARSRPYGSSDRPISSQLIVPPEIQQKLPASLSRSPTCRGRRQLHHQSSESRACRARVAFFGVRSSNDEVITTIVKNSRARGLKRPADFPRSPCRGSRRCRTTPWRLRPAT
jgi:hypothetical protein